MIQLNEQKEGYNAKMDKKSLLRILGKLQRDGQIKNITVNLQLGDKDKVNKKKLRSIWCLALRGFKGIRQWPIN